jgi:paraquat-inducible protein B
MLTGTIPEIPTSSSSDVEGTIQGASEFMNELNQLPLEQIASELHQSTRRIARLASSPSLPRTFRRVDDAAANVDEITTQARSQLPDALRNARKSLAEAEATLASTQSLLAANSIESSQPGNADVPQALYEVTRAARSIRELSDFLDRHPEALIEGRGLRHE